MPTDAPDGLVNAYVVHAAPKAPKKAAAPEVSVEEKATVVSEAHPVKKAAAKKTSTK